jgi:uncharacterized protein
MIMLRDPKSFIGNGLNFPLRTNARGELLLVTGAEDIEQSIRIILGTRPGERVMRPTFGCQAHELLFETRSPSTISQLQEYVEEALVLWEPRIEVQSVTVNEEDAGDGALLAEIEYIIKSTHDSRNLVYPFFIEPEAEIL